MDTTWKSYEEVATYLLNMFAKEFGLSHVEGKQSLKGKRSETNYIIDAKGFRQDSEMFVIIECRRYMTSKQNQEKIGALSYRIIDTGAASGIIVSPLGLQSGAQRIANAEGILSVQLHPDSTPTEFAMQFLNKIFVGHHEKVHLSDNSDATLTRHCINCQKIFSTKNNELKCHICA